MSNLDLCMLFMGTAMVLSPLIVQFSKNRRFTPAMVYILLGISLGIVTQAMPHFSLAYSDSHAKIIEHFTEVVVVLTLVSAGIKIDRPFDRVWWSNTWRLLGITMLSSIVALAALGYFVLHLPLPVAILLGAVLAPTDPVLAHDMQTGPPQQTEPEHHVRFTLTTEAGFNDGLAFPFTYLAIALHEKGLKWDVFWLWAGWDLVFRVLVGLTVGFCLGKVMGWFVFRVVKDQKSQSTMSQHFGIFVLGATLTTYALAELLTGYGFLAVFIAAVVGRSHKREHGYHKKTFKFLEQLEESLTCVLLLVLGAAIAYQGWELFNWKSLMVAFATVFLIRPLTGMLAMLKCSESLKNRFAVSFLGVRGIGSFYYLAYAAKHFKGEWIESVTHIVLCTVLVSVISHGASAPSLIKD